MRPLECDAVARLDVAAARRRHRDDMLEETLALGNSASGQEPDRARASGAAAHWSPLRPASMITAVSGCIPSSVASPPVHRSPAADVHDRTRTEATAGTLVAWVRSR